MTSTLTLKKTILRSLVVGAFLVGTAIASASTVAHYRFEGGTPGEAAAVAVDSSDNGYDLNALGSPLFSDDVAVSPIPRTGADNAGSVTVAGMEAAFVGTAGEGLSTVEFTDFTVEAWVRYQAFGNPQTIVGRDDAGGTGQGFRTESNHALLYFQSSNAGFRVEVVTDQNQLLSVNTGVQAVNGVWYHVAAVGDTQAGENGTLSFYIDGILVASGEGFTGLAAPEQETPWTIGRGQWAGGNADWFNGWIDEVRISNVALNPSEFLNFDPAGFGFLTHPEHLTVWSGEDAIFSATFESGENPTPDFHWEESIDGGNTWSEVTGADSLTLTLPSVGTARDRSWFRSVATGDEHTVFSDPALLRVGDGDPIVPDGVVGYYRFAEGAPGGTASGAQDSSGAGNNLTEVLGTPAYTADVSAGRVPATGAPNGVSVDFMTNTDQYAIQGVDGVGLSEVVFDDFTIEMFVNNHDIGGWQTYVGRDDRGEQRPGSAALFYFSNSGANNGYRLEAWGRNGENLQINSNFVPQTNRWYHLAAVGDTAAGTLTLYVDGEPIGSVGNFNGLFIPEPATRWTIGRGQFGADDSVGMSQGDWVNGMIDEVRFATAALTPVEFLNFHAAVLNFAIQPQDVVAAAQQDVTFTALAGGGSGTLVFQWEVSSDDGLTWQEISGATENTLTVESVTLAQHGNLYRVVATRGNETEISEVALLSVPSYPEPVIVQDLERGMLLREGEPFTFTVEATGMGNISYQWQRNGEDLAGETSNTLHFEAMSGADDEAEFSVVISDDAAMNEGLDPATVTLSSIVAVAPYYRGSISLNFVGTGSGEWGSSPEIGVIDPRETAGALPVRNWNNSASVTGVATQTTALSLIDDTGAGTSASATWSSANTWAANAVAGSPNLKDPTSRLFHGYIESRNADVNPATVTVQGIPYATYDVYVYPMGVEGGTPGVFARSVTIEDANGVRQLFMTNLLGSPTPAEIPLVLSHSTSLEDAQATQPATYFRFTGATGETLVLQHFDEVEWNSGGFAAISIVNTDPATPARPKITAAPVDRFVPAGSNVALSVQAVSVNQGGSLSYQWRRNGQNLAGQNAATLNLNDVTSANSGEYSVVVTDQSALGQSSQTLNATVLVVDGARPALLNVDVNVGGHAPMSGNARLRSTGLVPFVYPASASDNPMQIGLGDHQWNAVPGQAGATSYTDLIDSEGLLLGGVTLTIGGATGAEDDTLGGGLEDVNPGSGQPTYSAPLLRDYVFTEGEDVITVTLSGLADFAGREILLAVYALGKDSQWWLNADNQTPTQSDIATVTLAAQNSPTGEALSGITDQEEGREVRWNDGAQVYFEAVVASNGTVVWTVGPVPGAPGLNALNGFQVLFTDEGDAPPPPAGVAEWRMTYFGTSENSGFAADDADRDGDGFKNLIEYALGTDPTVAGEAHGAVSLGRAENFLTLTFRHIADSNLEYSIQATDNLNVGWSTVHVFPPFTTAGTQTYTDDVPIAPGSSRFIRLSVRLLE